MCTCPACVVWYVAVVLLVRVLWDMVLRGGLCTCVWRGSITRSPKDNILATETAKSTLDQAMKFGKIGGARATGVSLQELINVCGRHARSLDEAIGQAQAWANRNKPREQPMPSQQPFQ